MNQNNDPTQYTAAQLIQAGLESERRATQAILTHALPAHLEHIRFDHWPTLLAEALRALSQRHPDPAAFLATLTQTLTP